MDLDRLVSYSLVLVMFTTGCVGIKTPTPAFSVLSPADHRHQLVVLIDDDHALYNQVITGIHVASGGAYRVLKMQEHGFVQSAFLESLMALSPRALIALGPRASTSIVSARIVVPSAFSMVPRMENYELDRVFSAGIRMVPDVGERIRLVHALYPELRALGVIFSRRNSRNSMQKVRGLCDDEQLEMVAIEIQSTSDVLPALARHHEQFGALLMIDDPLLLDINVIAAMTSFLSEKSLSFFALDCSMVADGALAAFGTDFYNLGRTLVDLVNDPSKTKPFSETAFYDPAATLCLNLTTAKKINLGDEFVARAARYAAEKGFAMKIYQ